MPRSSPAMPVTTGRATGGPVALALRSTLGTVGKRHCSHDPRRARRWASRVWTNQLPRRKEVTGATEPTTSGGISEGSAVSDAWMPGIRYVRAAADGGPLKGGAPRVVWHVLGADPQLVSARSAAQRLDQGGYPSHLVWNPH